VLVPRVNLSGTRTVRTVTSRIVSPISVDKVALPQFEGHIN
jgi:hypothetical protein